VVVVYAAWIGPKLEPEVNATTREAVYQGAAVASGGSGPRGTSTAVADATGATSDSEDAERDPAWQLGAPPEGEKPHRVGLGLSSLPLVVPLLLIVANTVTTAVDQSRQGALSPDAEYTPSTFAAFMSFVGNPVVALLVGVILAVYVLLPRWTPRRKVHTWLAEAAASAGLIILITGAGGALGQVLRDSGVGDELAEAIAALSLPGVLVPFLVATLVRLAQGSGTVAMITAASVSAPLVGALGLSPLLAALACCAGSMVFSYFNDSYFWVVTRFTGLDGTAALRGWSGITTAVWLASLPMLLIASLFI
jgi:GntP family gluconate:H+ symporter